MTQITLVFLMIVLIFLVKQEDIKLCLSLWGVIFFLDYLIPISDETYFQVALFIDLCLLGSCSVIRERWKMFGCMFVLAISALLNLREGLSYYQTSTYTFLVYYQWLSIEIITAILLFKVRLRDDIFRISRTHH